MPSTLVHMALAGLLAAALLGESYDGKTLGVVLLITALADVDAFISLFSDFGHRAATHTLVLPALASVAIWFDTRRGHRSVILDRWGTDGVRVAWVSVIAFVVAAIGLDLFTGRLNPLWPLHDQFYRLDGKIVLSSTEGLVQTFVDLDPASGSVPAPEALGNSSEVHVSSGVDPVAGPEPESVERVFPIVRSGWQLLILLAGTGVMTARLAVPWDPRK